MLSHKMRRAWWPLAHVTVAPRARMASFDAHARRKVLIVGLGNISHPDTRHSVGHTIIDALANHMKVHMEYNRATLSYVGETTTTIRPHPPKRGALKKNDARPVEEEIQVDVVLVKPKPLMNLSGRAVSLAFKAFIRPASLHSVVVIHDSLGHAALKTSIKTGGSANGHNGVRSIIEALGGADFHRIRVGIGSHSGDASRFVLTLLPRPQLAWWTGIGGCNQIWGDVETLLTRDRLAVAEPRA